MTALFERLLPPDMDNDLCCFGDLVVTDAGASVPVSAVDQLLASLTRRLVADTGDRTAVVLLPRGRHETALLLGIATQILCRRPQRSLRGPVTVIARDLDLTARLRALGVIGGRRMGLRDGNPLNAHRVRGDGRLVAVHGPYPGDIDDALLYLNTRVGWPCLPTSSRGIAIIDATTVTSPDARERALEWADKHARVVVVIGDLGDPYLVGVVSERRTNPIVVPVTWEDLADIAAELGTRRPQASLLSSAPLLLRGAPSVTILHVDDAEINSALRDAFRALVVTPAGPFPFEVAQPAALINTGGRLLAHPDDYRPLAAMDPRVSSPTVLLRRIEQPFTNAPPAWRTWRTVHWGTLVYAARALWRRLDETQPKLDALWTLLERLDRRGGDTPIVIRSSNRATAAALATTLTHERRTPQQEALWNRVGPRVRCARFRDHYPWNEPTIDILAGSPPPDEFGLLTTGESSEIHILAYTPEIAALNRAAARWSHQIDEWRRRSAGAFGATVSTSTPAPVSGTAPGQTEPAGTATLAIPDRSLADVFAEVTAALDERPVETVGDRRPLRAAAVRNLLPVHLDGGRIWWAPSSDSVVVCVTAGGERTTCVRDLVHGDEIVVPHGDGNESVHARLVVAAHRDTDTASLDTILDQFRRAARLTLSRARNQAEAVQRVAERGAQHPAQLPSWANGKTIAPHEPGDMVAVFKAAGQPCPDLRLMYTVANRLRNLHRTLGRFVTLLRSPGARDTVVGLAGDLGVTTEVVEEILDEFVLATVVRVDAETPAPAHYAGRVA